MSNPDPRTPVGNSTPPPPPPTLPEPREITQCITTNDDNSINITNEKCLVQTPSKQEFNRCVTLSYDNNNNIITTVTEGKCPAQFTNVKSGRKSRKIEHFASNNNLKCKHNY